MKKQTFFRAIITMLIINAIYGCCHKCENTIFHKEKICYVPDRFIYSKYSNVEYDEEIIKLIDQFPDHLKNYFIDKIRNRLEIQIKCESKIKEWEIYKECKENGT